MLRIDYDPAAKERARFVAFGGDPRGRDGVETIVRRWPGWARSPLPGKIAERLASRWIAPDEPASVLGVRSSTLRIEWTPRAASRKRELELELASAKQALAMQDAPRLNLPRARIEPMPHQLRAVLALRHLGHRAMLCDEMGLGKSATALWAMQDADVRHLTIVCPATIKWNWQKEFEQTLGEGSFLEEPAEQVVFLIDGTPAQRASQFADLEHAVSHDEPTCTIINYDLLKQLTEEQCHVLANATEGVILDEAHYIKNRNTERTRMCVQLFGHAERRLLLTGTPVMNTIEDLYSQVTFARPGSWASYHDFAKRHLVINAVKLPGRKRKTRMTVAAKDIDGLNAVVNTLQIRRRKDEVLGLPPKIRTFPELELCDVTAPVYKAMRDFGILELQEFEAEETIFAPRVRTAALHAMMRCEQIAQGFCGGIPEPLLDKLTRYEMKAKRIPGRDEIVWPEAPKVRWALEALRTLHAQGTPPVLFSRFNAPMIYLRHVLETKDELHVGLLHGDVPAKQKAEQIEAFQSGKLDVMLCQVKVAQGFNLTRSHDVLFYGRDWSPAINAQAEDRCHRRGTKGTVNVQTPIVRATVEMAVHRKLTAKGANAEQALKDVTVRELMEAL